MDQRQPGRGFFWWCHFLIMLIAFFRNVHSRKRIGAYLLVIVKATFKKMLNLFSGNSLYRFHGNKSSSFTFVFNGYQYGLFSFGSMPSFSRFFPTNIGVIKFYQLIEKAIDTISIGHGCTDLFERVSGSRPGYTYMFRKTQSGEEDIPPS